MARTVNDPKKWGVGSPPPSPGPAPKTTVPNPAKQGGVK